MSAALVVVGSRGLGELALLPIEKELAFNIICSELIKNVATRKSSKMGFM
jgi:hypothetical protein